MFSKALHIFRKDYLSINLGVKLVVFVIFLRSLGWGFVDPYFSIYLNQFHQHYMMIGLFAALISFSSLITTIPLMRLADRMKEGPIIQDGELLYFFVIIGYIVAGIFKSIPLLVLTLFFNGVAQTLVVVATEAYIRKHNGAGKSGPFGFYVTLDFFGWIVGMLIAVLMVRYYTLNSMFLFVIPGILASFLILPRLHERGIRSLLKGIRRYFYSREDFFGIFADCKELSPKMFFFLILAFFDGVIRMFSFVFIPLFGLSIHLDLSSIALLMAVMYIPFIFSYLFSELSDRLESRMSVIAIGLFIGAFSFVSLYFIVGKVWLMILAASVSLSLAIIRPVYNGAITRLTPRRMLGEVTGFNNFADRVGRIVGPILTGLIADIYGIEITFLLIAVIAFGLGVLSLVLKGYDYLVISD